MPVTTYLGTTVEDLADKVNEEFASHRLSDEFKEVSLVVDSSRSEYPTLVVHVDGEGADSLAGRIKEFLAEHGARSQREYHSHTDIRLLATVD